MQATQTATASNPAMRLDLLERYLEEDPANPNLLADAFDAALAAGAWGAAARHAAAGRNVAGEGEASWALRQASLFMAQGKYADARVEFAALHARHGDNPAIAHGLGFTALMQGDHQAAMNAVAPWLDIQAEAQAPSPAQAAALQVTWLRAAHRAGLLDQALEWVDRAELQGRLDAATMGVASLIAVDGDRLPQALEWSQRALAGVPDQPEALVARATAALAQRDPQQARALLSRALARNDEDGRALSALGFTDMLENNLPRAQATFEQAVRFMPGHIGTWHGLGWSRLAQGDRAGAVQAFQQALALDHNFGESHGSLAVGLAANGDRAAAAEHAEKARRLDPGNMSGRYAELILSGQASDFQHVRRVAQRLLRQKKAPLGGDFAEWLGKEED